MIGQQKIGRYEKAVVELFFSYSTVVEILLYSQAILSNTRFDTIQSFTEGILLLLLLMKLNLRRFSKLDTLILFSALFIYGCSFFILPIKPFLISLKIFSFFFLILLVFQQNNLKFKFLKFIFVVNLLLTIHQLVTGHYIIPVNNIVKEQFDYFLNGRPWGLFFSFHMSGFFTGTCLILFLSKSKRLPQIISTSLVMVSLSYFSIVSYIFQILKRHELLIVLSVVFLGATWFHVNDLYNSLIFIKSRSFGTIYYQLADFSRLKLILNFFPRDYDAVNAQFAGLENYAEYLNRGLLVENEIQYFTILIQFGAPLAGIMLIKLFKSIGFFKIFIIVSLLHYGYIFSPLILTICMHGNKK